ncbi:cupin [Halostreptopolyspora alba]|uniref:Cupin n=1 Tax=Halostreptopolyspora alba TaxID=2487137 RepID=A0A3N0ED31_9ACTN|nr:cupin [Nocardiopsaceae bacterium YIM 96095]
MADETNVRVFTSADPSVWYQPGDRKLFLGDVLDASSTAAMSVGFARYAAGASNDWTMSYDEALIITTGRFSVRHAGGVTTAEAGEVIYLRAETELTYAAETDTELVYVTHPHWLAATEEAGRQAQLDVFQPVSPEATEGIVASTRA